MKSSCRYALLVAALIASIPTVGIAQQTPISVSTVATGVQAFGAFDGNGIETLNLGDLNNHLNIPIFHKAGRGMGFSNSLTYDSQVWMAGTMPRDLTGNFNWSFSGPAGKGSFITYQQFTEGNCSIPIQTPAGTQYADAGIEYYQYVYVDSVGNSHPFPSTTYTTNDCGSHTVSGFPVYASDNSGIQLQCNGCFTGTASVPSLTVVLPSGLSITGDLQGSANIQDNNGNYLSSTTNPAYVTRGGYFPVYGGIQSYVDTLGANVMSASATVVPGNYIDPPVSTVTMSYSGGDGNPHSFILQATQYEIATAFGCASQEFDSGIPSETYPTENVPFTLPTKLLLSDGTFYTFTYEPTQPGSSKVTGRIASITYPHGGSTQYVYGATNCSDLSPLSLTKIVNDANGNVSTWTYSRSYQSASAQWQTVVTDPQGNQTVFSFITGIPAPLPTTYHDNYTPATISVTSYYPVSEVKYAGAASGGLTMMSKNMAYAPGIQSGTFQYPIQSLTTTTSPGGGPMASTTIQNYNTLGLPTETTLLNYDGSTISHTVISYASVGSIITLPQSVGQYIPNPYSSGSTLSTTTYGYDELPVIATSGIANHVSVSGSRGNLTSITRNTGSGSVTTQNAYFDTGQLAATTDINGATTTYTYGECGGSFLSGTSRTVQPSGVVLATSTTWNCNGAVPVSSLDVNGNTQTTSYNDILWRPTSSTDALGNSTSISYPSQSTNAIISTTTYNGQVTTTSAGGGGVPNVVSGSLPTTVAVKTFDGLGRPILSQISQNGSSGPFTSVATSYDLLGRPTWTSIPYSATVGTYTVSGPGTTTLYDALNRPVSVTDAGGGTLSYSYNANDVLVTQGPAASGENVKSRSLEYDAAGELTSVCEITAGPSSGSCGQNTQRNGYLTAYSYSAGRLRGVSQNLQAGYGAAQTRTINYDLLGRKTSEYIPETGASSFNYDFDPSGVCSASSTGDLVKSVDNAGNVSCFAYDSLHRMLSSAVVAGPYSQVTPQTHIVYDAASFSGTPMQNALGGMAEAYTCAGNCSTKLTDVFKNTFPLKSGGQPTGQIVSQLWESTPNSGGYFKTQSVSNSNGTPSTLTATLNGAVVGYPSLSYAVDSVGRAVVAEDTTNGLWLTSNVSYNQTTGSVTGITFGNGDADTFGFHPVTGRPSSFAYSIGGSNSFYVSGGLTWNPNGSLQQFAMVDSSDPSKNQNCSYQVDDINRLSSVNCQGSWAQNFTYDPFGNISKSGPTSPAPGQITQSYMAGYSSINNQAISGVSAAYDANGNQTVSEAANMSWNAAAQPVSVNGIVATYDAFGRLVETGNSGAPQPATGSNGTITISGSEQSTPAGTIYNATATVTISGTEQSEPLPSPPPGNCAPEGQSCYDVGGGSLVVYVVRVSDGQTIDGTGGGFSFQGSSTSAGSIAASIVNSINGGNGGEFTASQSNGVITLNMHGAYPSPVIYQIVGGVGCGNAFPTCSFSMATPGTVTPTTGATIPPTDDSGTISASINGTAASYSWGSGSTAASIATGLANAINANDSAILTATVSGGTIQLASVGTGTATNLILSTGITNNTSVFYSPSYSISASGMSGGSDAVQGNGLPTQYIYSPAGGKMLIARGGQLLKGTVALPGGATAIYNGSGFDYFRHSDWLGSSRLATTWNHAVYAKEAYAPFGETYNEAGTADRSFTGQDQDSTLGIFDYLFRRYDPVAGRWMSPDPLGWGSVSAAHPQSLNRYAYVQNNPMSLIDGGGLDCIYAGATPSQTTIIAGDCLSDTDDGVFVDGHATFAGVSEDGNHFLYNVSQYTLANDPYDPDSSRLFNLSQAINGYVGPILSSGGLATFYGASAVGGAALLPTALFAGDAAIEGLGLEADHIVLGLDNAGLQGTADQIGARTLMGSTNLVTDFQTAMANPNTCFTICLDGVSGDGALNQISGAAMRGANGPSGGVFNYEMFQLMQNNLLPAARVFTDGAYLINPFLP